MDGTIKATALILILLLAACSDETFDDFLDDMDGTDAGAVENHRWPLSLKSIVNDMVLDDVGNLYITGDYKEQAVFGSTTLTSKGSSKEGFLAQLSPSGEFLWAISFGGPGSTTGWGLALGDDGSIFVSGCFWHEADFGVKTVASTSDSEGDTFVAKLAGDKTFEWVTTFDGLIQKVALDNAGNIILIGSDLNQDSFGSITIDGMAERGIVAKLDPDGDFVWVTPVGDFDQPGFAGALEVDPAGNTYIAGAFNSQGMSLTLGDITLTGKDPSSGELSLFTAYVAKLSPAGEFIWATSATASGGDISLVGAGDIALDQSGNIYITGQCTGDANFGGHVVSCPEQLGNMGHYVAKLSADGTFVWAKSVMETNVKGLLEHIALDPQGNIYAVGKFEEDLFLETGPIANKGAEDLLVTKLSPTGDLLWAKSAGGGMSDTAMSFALDHAGEIYVTGQFKGNAVFDGVVLSAPEGQRNSYIWRVEQLE